jgi:cytochrome b6-f complex iron-sulfur subunit
MSSADWPRRAILKLSLSLSGVLALGGLIKYLAYPTAPTPPTRFTLAAPATYAIGTATFVPQARVYLVRDEAGLYALSALCTHLGCTINAAPQQFNCPCHGSQFDRAGRVLHGPAAQPLPHFEVSLSPEGLIVVDTSKTVSVETRWVG